MFFIACCARALLASRLILSFGDDPFSLDPFSLVPVPPTVFALDLASLSLAPVDCAGRGLVQTGKDVLCCWPHEYSCVAENALWTGGLKESDWADATGRQGGTVFLPDVQAAQV